jgi:glycosyltransferase involved in cell wall biosynthesis
MALHELLARIVRAVMRSRWSARSPAGERGDPKIQILLMHAWGMGGTIRSILNAAGHLAECHDVEVLSVVRRRGEPFFGFPARLAVTAIDDQRPKAAEGASLARRLLRRLPSMLLHPSDRARLAGTMWTDVQLLRTLWSVRHGILIGTRPVLNLLAVDTARPGVRLVGMEHMNYAAHTPAQRAQIRKRYGELDCLTVLTTDDLREYRSVLGDAIRVERIPNSIPDPTQPPSPLSNPIVLAAGRLERQKGFDRLVPAFAGVAARHPDWTLRICGRGHRRNSLERLIIRERLWNNVFLMGAVPEMEEQMRLASMFVLSSRFEGLPMVMLEAMSMGLPIVSFDCPTGPSEVIRHGENGILVPDGDIEALGAAIVELIEDEEKRRRMGKAAASTAESYRSAAVAPRWEALIESLAS